MCEPLKNCEDTNDWGEVIFYERDIKSAVAFYKRWSYRPNGFYECFGAKLSKGTLRMFDWILEDTNSPDAIRAYSDFLFNYTFKDVIDNES